MAVQQPTFRGRQMNLAADFMRGADWAERNRSRRAEEQRASQLFAFKEREQEMAAKALALRVKGAEIEYQQMQSRVDQQGRAMTAIERYQQELDSLASNEEVSALELSNRYKQLESNVIATIAKNPEAAGGLEPFYNLVAQRRTAADGSAAMEGVRKAQEAQGQGRYVSHFIDGAERPKPENPYEKVEVYSLGGGKNAAVGTGELTESARLRLTSAISLASTAENPARAFASLQTDPDFAPMFRLEEAGRIYNESMKGILGVQRSAVSAAGDAEVARIEGLNRIALEKARQGEPMLLTEFDNLKSRYPRITGEIGGDGLVRNVKVSSDASQGLPPGVEPAAQAEGKTEGEAEGGEERGLFSRAWGGAQFMAELAFNPMGAAESVSGPNTEAGIEEDTNLPESEAWILNID